MFEEYKVHSFDDGKIGLYFRYQEGGYQFRFIQELNGVLLIGNGLPAPLLLKSTAVANHLRHFDFSTNEKKRLFNRKYDTPFGDDRPAEYLWVDKETGSTVLVMDARKRSYSSQFKFHFEDGIDRCLAYLSFWFRPFSSRHSRVKIYLSAKDLSVYDDFCFSGMPYLVIEGIARK